VALTICVDANYKAGHLKEGRTAQAHRKPMDETYLVPVADPGMKRLDEQGGLSLEEVLSHKVATTVATASALAFYDRMSAQPALLHHQLRGC
jgi:hypothetical protein